MEAGSLRHRVVIQQLVAGSPQQTGSGAPDETWTTYLTVWAAIEPLRGRELFAAQEHHAEVTHKVTIRYRSGVNDRMRVVFESTNYPIAYVLDPELRHAWLHLYCTQGVAES